MDAIQNLLMGFTVALTPQNLLFAFLGSVLGTLIGVLPGIGPVAGVAMLIPLTFQMAPTGAIIMLTALFYGTQYGGSKIDVLCGNVGDLLAQFKSGEMRILGIMDDEESPFYPGVKTFEAQGYKLYNSASRGFSAPAGTPKEIVNILSGAIKKAVATDEHKKRMREMGLTLRYLDPAQYAKYWEEYEATLKELLPLTKE